MSGLSACFGSPLRPTCPRPAARRLRPTLRIVVSPVRAPSVCLVALSPLCPDVYTPNGFVFRTTTPCDLFRPRAGFHVKQITALAALCLQPRRDQPLSPPPLLCAPHIAKAQQHIKTTSHPRLAFESDVVVLRLFLCRAVALRLFSHSLSRPRVFFACLPGLRDGLLRGERCPGLSRFESLPPREDKGRRSVVRGESRQKSGFSL